MKKLIGMVMMMGLILFTACEDEEEVKEDYYGDWTTKVYDAYNLQMQPIKEKRTFSFTNTTFETVAFQGATEDAIAEALKLAGTVEKLGTDSLKVEFIGISLGGAGMVDKSLAPTEFANSFSATAGKQLLEKFNAAYTVTGDSMKLIIPTIKPIIDPTSGAITGTVVVSDEVNLGKVN